MHNNLELNSGSVLPWVNHCYWLCLHVLMVLKCTDAEAPTPTEPHLCRQMRKMPSTPFNQSAWKHLWMRPCFYGAQQIYNHLWHLYVTALIRRHYNKCTSTKPKRILWQRYEKQSICGRIRNSRAEIRRPDWMRCKICETSFHCRSSFSPFLSAISSPVSQSPPAFFGRYFTPRAISVPVFSLHSLCVFLSKHKKCGC